MFKTGDRVEVLHHRDVDPAYWGLEGKIVAWVPRRTAQPTHPGLHTRTPHPGDFYICFDDPPDQHYFANEIHQGGPWNPAWVKPAPPEMTIGEIADLFGVDPYDIAIAALKEEQ